MKRFILLLGAFLLGATSLLAKSFLVDGVNYYVTSNSEPYTVQVVPLPHADDDFNVYYSGDIVIPEQVTYDGITYAVTRLVEGTFQSCQNLHSVVIPNSVTFIGTAAFNGCTNLTSVVMPKNIIRIESTTFSHCTSLQSIEIPNTVIEIARLAFLNCSSLTSIDIPNSVTFIGESAFLSCTNLQSVKMSNSVERIEAQAFLQCSSLQTIDIPNSVTFLGEKAFLGCTSLQSISMSNYIRFIENETFCSCSSLKTISLPNSIESIGQYAFAGCSELSSVEIPNSIKSIEKFAFTSCENLSSIFCYSEVSPQISWNSFLNLPNDKTLYVPFNCIDEYKKTEQWDGFSIVELPMVVSEVMLPFNATVKLYPNPISDYAVLEFDNAGNDLFQLTISDVTGKVVNTMQTSGNSFIVGKGLDKGVYLYSLKNTQTNQVYRNSFIVE